MSDVLNDQLIKALLTADLAAAESIAAQGATIMMARWARLYEADHSTGGFDADFIIEKQARDILRQSVTEAGAGQPGYPALAHAIIAVWPSLGREELRIAAEQHRDSIMSLLDAGAVPDLQTIRISHPRYRDRLALVRETHNRSASPEIGDYGVLLVATGRAFRSLVAMGANPALALKTACLARDVPGITNIIDQSWETGLLTAQMLKEARSTLPESFDFNVLHNI
jgi:hypothetical protein